VQPLAASSPSADIRHRNTVDFSTLEPVTVTEVEKLIAAINVSEKLVVNVISYQRGADYYDPV